MLLLVIAGMIIAAVVGTVWYSNATPMGKIHMAYLGFDKLSKEEAEKRMKEAKPMMAKMYAAQMTLSFLTSVSVVFTVSESIWNGVPFSISILFPIFNWLCFMVPIIGSSILWSNCDRRIAWKKFFSDIFANLLIVILIAILAGLFA